MIVGSEEAADQVILLKTFITSITSSLYNFVSSIRIIYDFFMALPQKKKCFGSMGSVARHTAKTLQSVCFSPIMLGADKYGIARLQGNPLALGHSVFLKLYHFH